MTVTYVAETRDHILMLDEEGVCLYVQRRRKGPTDDSAVDGALRCIGAQYVAALDAGEPGLLAHDPVIGSPMLFAAVNESGRVSVVRTGPLERFEARGSGFYGRPAGRQVHRGDAEVEVEVQDTGIAFLPDDCVEDDDQTMPFRRSPQPMASARAWRSTLRVG